MPEMKEYLMRYVADAKQVLRLSPSERQKRQQEIRKHVTVSEYIDTEGQFKFSARRRSLDMLKKQFYADQEAKLDFEEQNLGCYYQNKETGEEGYIMTISPSFVTFNKEGQDRLKGAYFTLRVLEYNSFVHYEFLNYLPMVFTIVLLLTLIGCYKRLYSWFPPFRMLWEE